MTPDEIGEYLEHQGATDDEIDEFLEHFGVKGMRWGVRKERSQAQIRADRKKGLGVNQLRAENKRVAAAGGGLRGTIKVRKEMIKNGELSKEQARKGSLMFGRNLALGLAGGALIGLAAAKGGATIARGIAGARDTVPMIGRDRVSELRSLSGRLQEFGPKGPRFGPRISPIPAPPRTMPSSWMEPQNLGYLIGD